VDQLARSGHQGPGLSEVKARLLAQTEKELGLINRHQAVEAFNNWLQIFEGDHPGQFFPDASPKKAMHEKPSE
jgi:hypothetical protein